MNRQATKIASEKTGLTAYVIPRGENALEWDIIKEESLIELTKRELLLGKAKGFNLDKFLLVKQLLLSGKSYGGIKETTGIAKTTIANYKKYYCKETFELMNKG